jgi:stage II sporulation SpoAA-like protein
MMQPPPNVELHEHVTSTWWIEASGLLCSVSKKNSPDITREQSIAQLEDLRRVTGNKKMCMLLDITYARPTKKEDREFGAEELAKIVKALALVSNSPLGKMVANLFFNLKPPPYPTKMFTNEDEARAWLNQYL